MEINVLVARMQIAKIKIINQLATAQKTQKIKKTLKKSIIFNRFFIFCNFYFYLLLLHL